MPTWATYSLGTRTLYTLLVQMQTHLRSNLHYELLPADFIVSQEAQALDNAVFQRALIKQAHLVGFNGAACQEWRKDFRE